MPQSLPLVATGILPAKLEQSLAQLEAEPAGVGLDPTATYDDVADAASAVLRAMARVRARPGPLHPAYSLLAADVYPLDPIAIAAPATFVALGVGPTAFTLEHASDSEGFLIQSGYLAFVLFGRSESASRDQPQAPTRRYVAQVTALTQSAGFSPLQE